MIIIATIIHFDVALHVAAHGSSCHALKTLSLSVVWIHALGHVQRTVLIIFLQVWIHVLELHRIWKLGGKSLITSSMKNNTLKIMKQKAPKLEI